MTHSLSKKRILLPRLVIYVLALIHGSLSSPWPKSFGAPEAIVGALLVAYIIIIFIYNNERVPNYNYMYQMVPFIYMITIPLVMTISENYHSRDVIRDYIPIFFFFFPVLIYKIDKVQSEDIISSLMIIAFLFSIRQLHQSGSQSFSDIIISSANLSYFSWSPSLLFASVVGLCSIFNEKRNLIKRAVFSGIGIMSTFLLLGSALRAPSAFLVVCVAIFSLSKLSNGSIYYKALAILSLLALIAASIMFIPGEYVSRILEKNNIEGASAKLMEIGVIYNINGTLTEYIFGHGWGYIYYNPIGFMASFTHNVSTYFYIKSGVIGLIMVIIYFIIFLYKGYRLIEFSVYIACVSSIAGSFLEATYKTVEFGLILGCLSPCLSVQRKALKARRKRPDKLPVEKAR